MTRQRYEEDLKAQRALKKDEEEVKKEKTKRRSQTETQITRVRT